MIETLRDLPDNVQRVLEDLVEKTKDACGDDLVSVVLFGSAAEGRMRASSDVNLIFVLRKFDAAKIDGLREKLRLAQAAIDLHAMFLLQSEIGLATEAFAVKFLDIVNRNRILYGTNPFEKLEISREATIDRLLQVILNLNMRLRERYAVVSLREEQLAHVIADVAGPIRASAATIARLQGQSVSSPKEALASLTSGLPGSWDTVLANVSRAREEGHLKVGEASATLVGLLDLLSAMQKHVETLR